MQIVCTNMQEILYANNLLEYDDYILKVYQLYMHILAYYLHIIDML